MIIQVHCCCNHSYALILQSYYNMEPFPSSPHHSWVPCWILILLGHVLIAFEQPISCGSGTRLQKPVQVCRQLEEQVYGLQSSPLNTIYFSKTNQPLQAQHIQTKEHHSDAQYKVTSGFSPSFFSLYQKIQSIASFKRCEVLKKKSRVCVFVKNIYITQIVN